MKSKFIAYTFACVFLLSGCGDPITTGVTSAFAADKLDEAIGKLQTESTNWRATLERLQSQLTDDSQSTLRNEVTNLTNEAIAAAGAEVRCNADFIGARVREKLIALRAALTGGTPPPLTPVACSVSPVAIDTSLPPERRSLVKVAGWNFSRGPVRAALFDRGSSRDISSALGFPTTYLMTIDLSGSGAPISESSERIELTANGRPLSQISVLQPHPLVNQLTITFTTGEHGPRRGHDIRAFIVLKSGRQIRAADRFASGGEWAGGSVERVEWNIGEEVPLSEITTFGITFEDGDCTACRGDDWHLAGVKVEVTRPSRFKRTIFDVRGNPLLAAFHERGTWSRPFDGR